MEEIRPTSLKLPRTIYLNSLGHYQQVTRTPVPSKRANREFTVRYKGVSEKSRGGTAWTSGYRTRKKLSPFLPFFNFVLLCSSLSLPLRYTPSLSLHVLTSSHTDKLTLFPLGSIDRQQRELYDLLVSWLAWPDLPMRV